MKPVIQVDVRILLLGVAVVVLLTAVFSISVFSLGQKNGLRLASAAGQPDMPAAAAGAKESASDGMPALPKAMTATPRPKDGIVIAISDSQATQFASDQMVASGAASALQVDEILFSDSAIELRGNLNLEGFCGEFQMSGLPAVESQQLHFRVSSLALDGQPLPQFLFPLVEQEVDSLFKELLTGYSIQEANLNQGQLSLSVIPW